MTDKEDTERVARRQVKKSTAEVVRTEADGEYNIWYNKYTGTSRKEYDSTQKAEYRCSVSRDAGKNKATPGRSFCIHFARGRCFKGPECFFHHRIPTEADHFDLTYDCFGRPKHRQEREDKSGTGSYENDNRTLYISPIHMTTQEGTEETIHRHFSEWGEISTIRFLPTKSVAFVRYELRACAEFAKEAMYGQSLDHGEVLNIRWAEQDANELVMKDNKRKIEQMVAEKAAERLPEVGNHGNYLQYEEQEYFHENKKAKAGDVASFAKYYEDCAKYYRDNGDHSTAATYMQYAQYYQSLSQQEFADSADTTQNQLEASVSLDSEKEESGEGEASKTSIDGKSAGALGMLGDYASDDDSD